MGDLIMWQIESGTNDGYPYFDEVDYEDFAQNDELYARWFISKLYNSGYPYIFAVNEGWQKACFEIRKSDIWNETEIYLKVNGIWELCELYRKKGEVIENLYSVWEIAENLNGGYPYLKGVGIDDS